VRAIGLVARREIRERLKARSFRIATIISIGVVVAAIVIPSSQKGHRPTYDVAVINPPTASTADSIKALQRVLGVRLRLRDVTDATAARAQLRTGRLDVVVIGADQILVKRAAAEGGTDTKGRLIAAIGTTIRVQRFIAQAGPAAASLLQALQQPVPVTAVVPRTASLRERFTAYFGVFFIFIFMQQYSAWVLIGVVEEKASRVVEVILSAIRPRQLVAGKVLGIGAVAVLQAIAVAIAAVVAATMTGSHIFEGASRLVIAWCLAWFVLGYGMFSWMYAAVGSLVSRQADAQNASFPLSVPMLVAFISINGLLSGGDPSPFVRVLSFLPFTAPLVMPMLVGIGKASALASLGSMAITAVAIFGLARLAGDIYSRAVLHSGQRLHMRQVLRRDFNAA
jgi:ABC-2 type transport system permease protein